MTHIGQRLSANIPGRLESHPVHIVGARPHFPAQDLDFEDLESSPGDIVHDDEHLPTVAVDEEAFRLHLQFTQAHGIPQGEFTTFVNVGAPSGADDQASPPQVKR